MARRRRAPRSAGRLAGLAIERATALALAGDVQGIVTAPIDKHALFAGGYDFPGHTEMLAALTGSHVAMMLASDRLRVVLVTTHIALAQCASRAHARADSRVRGDHASRAAAALRNCGAAGSRCARSTRTWATAAASAPRTTHCSRRPLVPPNILGPFPADTVFVRAMRGAFDAVLAPYHDVGMTAIKVASFGSAVNVTLGCPSRAPRPITARRWTSRARIVRIPSSMIEAILECARFADALVPAKK